MELEAKVSIKKSRDEVWNYFTNPSNWKQWWGGALARAEPGWDRGAGLVWELGSPSTILNLITLKQVEIQNVWSITTWRFIEEKPDSTLVAYKEQFTGGASMNPGTWQADIGSRLSELKKCVENAPSSASSSQRMGSMASEGATGNKAKSWFEKLFGRGKKSQTEVSVHSEARTAIDVGRSGSTSAEEAIDRQAEMWRQMGFTVGGVESTKEAARKVAAVRPTEVWFDEAVSEMVSIYREHPDGFIQGRGGAPEQRLRGIGEMLDQRGGMELMRAAHSEFAGRCDVRGAARNLEFVWDGIGSWMG